MNKEGTIIQLQVNRKNEQLNSRSRRRVEGTSSRICERFS